MLLKNPRLHLTEESVKIILAAKKEYMEGLCDMLEKKYGGAERYFREHLGMTADEVEAMKTALTSDEPPIFPEKQGYLRRKCSPPPLSGY